MWLLLCGKGVGRGVEVAVFITQFPVLHDVKKKTCLFARYSQKSWQISAWVPFLSSWCMGPRGAHASCFQARGHFGSLLVSSPHSVPVAT